MKGKITWLGIAISLIYGVGGYFAGLHDMDVMMGFVTGSVGMLGIGRKVEKVGKANEEAQAKNIEALVSSTQVTESKQLKFIKEQRMMANKQLAIKVR